MVVVRVLSIFVALLMFGVAIVSAGPTGAATRDPATDSGRQGTVALP